MQGSIKYNSLYETEPELVKEWHPTANGNLTPRTVKIDYPKPVWWICSQSHEWDTTIQARINGAGCPVCTKNRAKERLQGKADKSLRPMKVDNAKLTSKESKIIFDSDFSEIFSGQDVGKADVLRAKAQPLSKSPQQVIGSMLK